MPKQVREETEEPLEANAETEDLITKVARDLGSNARAEAVFGEPVERDHVTVIPVASASLGLGGGIGTGHGQGNANNIGAGLRLTPVGFIELANGKVRFRRILATWAFVSVALGIGTLAGLLLLKPGR